MRYSNYIFTKGSIVFIRFAPSSAYTYLNGRPLIVVSNPSHIMRTLLVCTTGTQDKPGIAASFYNYAEKMYVGGAEISTIYPYNIMTIYTDQIECCIGQLDPYIMKAVDKAIDFHLGRTDEIPPYLEQYEAYLTGVDDHHIKEKYIFRGDVVNSNVKVPYKYKMESKKPVSNPIPPKPAPAPTPVTPAPVPTPKKPVTDPIIIKPAAEPIRQKMSTAPISKNAISNVEIDAWVKDSVTSINITSICRNDSALIKAIDEKSVSMIVSRLVPISLIAKKYGINQRNATFLRISLTNISVKLAVSILNSHNNVNTNLSDYIVIGMALIKAFSPEAITFDNKRFDTQIDKIVERYRINTEDRRTWRAVENFYSK